MKQSTSFMARFRRAISRRGLDLSRRGLDLSRRGLDLSRRGLDLSRRGLGLLAMTVISGSLAGGTLGCSVNATNQEACTTDAQCSVLGAGYTCNTDGYCDAAAGGECVTNQDCVDTLGEFHVCRKSDAMCVSLVNTLCTSVEGDYTRDDAIMFGSVLPLQGADEGTGRSEFNGIALALSDFSSTVNGLPPLPGSESRRPLVHIGCNDNADSDTSVEAAKYLVDEIGVPAVLGGAYSGITIRMTTEATIPGGALTISPSATSVAITDLDDNGLVWRTSPSDVFQGTALASFIPQVETTVRTELSLAAGDKIKVSILHKSDAYGSGLAKAVEQLLEFNGVAALDTSNNDFYNRLDYGDPDNPTENPPIYGQVVSTVLAEQPHIIPIFGTSEGLTEILTNIEAGWDDNVGYRPRYLLADAALQTVLWETVVGSNDDLRRRVAGTVPGTDSVLFNAFRVDFNANFNDGVSSPETFGAAGAYDATYLLAYAATALGAEPVTGANLAQALTRMVPAGTDIPVGAGAISDAFQALGGGGNIDFRGASGPLDFDVMTGEAPSDILIWCLPETGGAAQPGVPSGVFYNAATSTLEGSALGAQCDQ